MKINLFNFLKNNSTSYKNNFIKCSKIFKDLLVNKENFFFNTLSAEYQKTVSLKKSILKQKLHKNILVIGMGGSVLGSKMFSSFFGLDKNYYFLDNLNNSTVNNFIKKDLDFYEKSRGAGGRCSTRRVEDVGLFDHGLQYIKNPNPEFKEMLSDCSIWQGNFKIFENNQLKNDADKERIIHENGNNLLVKNLFKNKNIFINKELKSIEKKADYLQLTFKDEMQEEYKTVIITAPFQQAYNLTKQFTENFFSKFNFSMQPNLTVMVAFNKSLKLDLSAITFENDDVLGFAANENTKKKNLINKDLELWTD
ncbi:MAG: hypothetical protein EBU78_01515 [Proteobacteria bacterium]|nr:hypothetical protein [Candidatus Fonsibacter lacus]